MLDRARHNKGRNRVTANRESDRQLVHNPEFAGRVTHPDDRPAEPTGTSASCRSGRTASTAPRPSPYATGTAGNRETTDVSDLWNSGTRLLTEIE